MDVTALFSAVSQKKKRSQAKEEFRAGQLCKVNQLGESIQRRLKAMEPSKPDTSADTAQEIPL